MCLYCEGSAGRISPRSEGPPAVSLGCRSHSWAPRSQTTPPSGELPARANTLSSFSETGTLTRGFLSCAAVSGTTWTTVGMWEKTETRASFIIEVTPIFYPSSTQHISKQKGSSYFLSHLLDCTPQVLLNCVIVDLNKKSFESHEQFFLVKCLGNEEKTRNISCFQKVRLRLSHPICITDIINTASEEIYSITTSLLSHHWYRTYFLFQSDRAEYRWQNIIISQSIWSLIFRVYFLDNYGK